MLRPRHARDGADGTGRQAGAAGGASGLVDFGQGNTAWHKTKTDGARIAGFAAHAALDSLAGQAAVVDAHGE